MEIALIVHSTLFVFLFFTAYLKSFIIKGDFKIILSLPQLMYELMNVLM